MPWQASPEKVQSGELLTDIEKQDDGNISLELSGENKRKGESEEKKESL